MSDINDILEPLNIEYMHIKYDKEIRKKVKDENGNEKRIRETIYISKNNNTKNIFLKEDGETKTIDLKIYDLISNFDYNRKNELKENNKINFIPESDDE
jgi:hypothetical protein